LWVLGGEGRRRARNMVKKSELLCSRGEASKERSKKEEKFARKATWTGKKIRISIKRLTVNSFREKFRKKGTGISEKTNRKRLGIKVI